MWGNKNRRTSEVIPVSCCTSIWFPSMLFPQQSLQFISAKSVTNSLINGKTAALAAQGANCHRVLDSQKFTEMNVRGENKTRKRSPVDRRNKLWEHWNNRTDGGLTSGTPCFLQASRKFSTFRRHLAMPSLGWKQRQSVRMEAWGGGIHCHTDRKRPTAAGEGTWMPATEHGWRWLARWQSTTPSIRNSPRSSGRMSFSRLSMLWGGSKSSRYWIRA